MYKIPVILFLFFLTSTNKEYTYVNTIKAINKEQKIFQQLYKGATTENKKHLVLSTREFLTTTLTEKVFPQWYGTPWDFNGTSRTPKEGTIACGYFVTNVLSDLGFRIPRIKWAQSASEVFIKKLSFGAIDRFQGKTIQTIKEYLLNEGDGIYLVGLDNHTGFVSVLEEEICFIHADYYESETGVKSQDIEANSPLTNSQYRVFGKLFQDELLQKWLENEPIN